MNNGIKNYVIEYGAQTPQTNLLDADLFYDDPGSTIEFSNATGLKRFGSGVKKNISNIQKRKQTRVEGKAAERAAQLEAARALAKQPSGPTVNKTVVKPASDKKDNTWMYVGIGAGVLVLGTLTYFLVKKK